MDSTKYELLGIVRHTVESGIIDVIQDKSKSDEIWISIRKVKIYEEGRATVQETRLTLQEVLILHEILGKVKI